MEIARRQFVLGLLAAPLAAQSDWDDPFPPHKVIGNVYFVGSAGLASFLITTPRGDILINSSFERTVPLIQASVAKLGFRFRDIKILLDSHAHNDHVAGNALVKRLTGAQVMAMEGDAEVISSGGAGPPCKIDRVLHDGDTVSLGGMVLTAHLTPGHTKGCTSWSFTAEDGGKPYRVVIVGSLSVNPGTKLVNNPGYPQIAEDYERSFRVLKALPCDVFLAPHGMQYDLREKYAKLRKGGPNPFIDPQGYRTYVETSEQKFLAELEKQKKATQ